MFCLFKIYRCPTHSLQFFQSVTHSGGGRRCDVSCVVWRRRRRWRILHMEKEEQEREQQAGVREEARQEGVLGVLHRVRSETLVTTPWVWVWVSTAGSKGGHYTASSNSSQDGDRHCHGTLILTPHLPRDPLRDPHLSYLWGVTYQSSEDSIPVHTSN